MLADREREGAMDDARHRVRERIAGDLNRVSRWVASLRKEGRPQEWEGGGDNTPLSEAADAAQVIEERETEIQLLDWLVGRSVELRDALRRIDDGTYGVCEACEQFIHPERLLALPEATLCLDCQTDLEAHRSAHPAPLPSYPGTAASKTVTA
jgi:RNA polymerase-binding transcription factor DksA